jgi:hypothetical protein
MQCWRSAWNLFRLRQACPSVVLIHAAAQLLRPHHFVGSRSQASSAPLSIVVAFAFALVSECEAAEHQSENRGGYEDRSSHLLTPFAFALIFGFGVESLGEVPRQVKQRTLV